MRRPTAPVRMVMRARIILAAASHASNARIAAQVGADVGTVRRVRHRYVTEGIAALHDRPRPGRPLVYDLDARLLVVATATSRPPGAATAWSHADIAAHLNGQHRIPISPSQVGRILADLDVKPHLVRGWLNRPADPAFFAKARCTVHGKIITWNDSATFIEFLTEIDAAIPPHLDIYTW